MKGTEDYLFFYTHPRGNISVSFVVKNDISSRVHTLQKKAARNVFSKSAVRWSQGRQRDDGIRVTHLVSPLGNVIAGTL